MVAQIELRDYQVEFAEKGAYILRTYGTCLLAMEMRVGKTLTALSIAERLGVKLVLFVTKKKAIPSIDIDMAKMYGGVMSKWPFLMVIVNFEMLHKVDSDFDLVIVDECHSIGAFPTPSQRAKELKRICANKPYVLFLSGTPTPESFSQLYHQFWISHVSPWAQYKNFYAWAKDYVTVKKMYAYRQEFNDYSDAHKEKVLSDIMHLSLSYTQEEAGFKQTVVDKVLTVDAPEVVHKVVAKLNKDRVMTTKRGTTVTAGTALALMQKAHQAYSGTIKDDQGEGIAFSAFKAEHIQQYFAGKKIAIFYKYVAEAELLRQVFGNRIVDTPELFNESGPESVFISQIQSGREGVNLSTADALVMYNIDFSAVSYIQGRARMQSIDRDDEAVVYWVMSNGGIEGKIYNVVVNKMDYTTAHYKTDFLKMK